MPCRVRISANVLMKLSRRRLAKQITKRVDTEGWVTSGLLEASHFADWAGMGCVSSHTFLRLV